MAISSFFFASTDFYYALNVIPLKQLCVQIMSANVEIFVPCKSILTAFLLRWMIGLKIYYRTNRKNTDRADF